MAKEFELKMSQKIFNELYDKWDSVNVNIKEFADTCATWGANQEYQESYNFIDDAWGSDHARVYQESRRPKIQTEKEKALEALDYIDEMAIDNMNNYTWFDKLKEHRNFLYKLIESMSDEDT